MSMGCLFFFSCIFFFQAEDGIRDLVRSRGLGDVYKRQVFDMGDVDATLALDRFDQHGHDALVVCCDLLDRF